MVVMNWSSFSLHSGVHLLSAWRKVSMKSMVIVADVPLLLTLGVLLSRHWKLFHDRISSASLHSKTLVTSDCSSQPRIPPAMIYKVGNKITICRNQRLHNNSNHRLTHHWASQQDAVCCCFMAHFYRNNPMRYAWIETCGCWWEAAPNTR